LGVTNEGPFTIMTRLDRAIRPQPFCVNRWPGRAGP